MPPKSKTTPTTTPTIEFCDDFDRIPKLSSDGQNWVIYKERLKILLSIRELEGHITGTAIKPEDADELETWEMNEAIVMHLIASTIPDSFYMKIESKGTCKEAFDTLTKEIENHFRTHMADLKKKLMNTRYADNGDMLMRVHFAALQITRENLALIGETIEDEEYINIIIRSIPKTYGDLMATIAGTARILGQPLKVDRIQSVIIDEYDRRKLLVNNEDRGKKGKTANTRSKITCFNCNKKGHKKADCWAKGGGKEGQKHERRRARASY